MFSLPAYMIHAGEADLAAEAYRLSESDFSLVRPPAGDSPGGRHDLYVWISALLIKLFGFDIGTVRILPILSSLLLLYSMFRYIERYGKAGFVQKALLGALVFCLPQFFIYAKVALPMMTAALFGFLSFFSLRKYFYERKTYDAFVSGALAGAAMLCEASGAVFMLTAFTLFLLNRRFLHSGFFLVSSLAVFFIFVMAAAVAGIGVPFRLPVSDGFSWFAPLASLSLEFRRYVAGPGTVIFALLTAVIIMADRLRLFSRDKFLAGYGLLCLLFTALCITGKSPAYILYILPYAALIIYGAHSSSRLKKRYVPLICILLLAYYAWGVNAQLENTGKKQHVKAMDARIGEHIPRGARVLAPASLFFEQAQRLDVVSADRLREEAGGRPTIDMAAEFMRERRIEYLVVTRYMPQRNRIADMGSREYFLSRFGVVRETADYGIYRMKEQ